MGRGGATRGSLWMLVEMGLALAAAVELGVRDLAGGCEEMLVTDDSGSASKGE